MIYAEDCSLIEGSTPDSRESARLYSFSLNEKQCYKVRLGCISGEDDSPIVAFDREVGLWRAGRYIGAAALPGMGSYELKILPRFGDEVLIDLLGEAFHFKLSEERYASTDKSKQLTVRNLMAVIWLAKLERSSRYGLPRVNVSETASSRFVRGKVDITGTIKSHPHLDKVVTKSRRKRPDFLIAEILRQAMHEIRFDIIGKSILVSDTVQETIDYLNGIPSLGRRLTIRDYDSIRYHPIYAGFKEAVDFSWQIIKGAWSERQEEAGRKSIGYFLDMAELWEIYVRNKLSSILAGTGYALVPSKYETYGNRFFRRSVIPDIVFERDGSYIVFDAKYKAMGRDSRAIDVDRSDFFQIHSYMYHLRSMGEVRMGGLIYPCSGGPVFDSGPAWGNQSETFVVGGPRVEKGFGIDWGRVEDGLAEALG